MRHFTFFLLLLGFINLSAQSSLLQSGPMLGYSEMREVLLWVQTTEAAEVQFAYWPQGKTDQRKTTASYQTKAIDAFTASIPAIHLEPGTHYDYQLLINNEPITLKHTATFTTQSLWQWRTDPPDFTIAVGSCSYINEAQYDRPGTPYGSDYQIFEQINNAQPDAMLWLGDNTYLREVDWNSRSGILYRYTHTRSTKELQALLANTHHYAIWDDHDYGPNDSDRSYILKDVAREVFTLFWGNPSYGLDGKHGITTAFTYNDMDFFLLDNRYFRTPNGMKIGTPTILGETQLEWIIDALIHSSAPFKMVAVGGQVLNTAKIFETYSLLAPQERGYLLRRIEEEGITGVIFLSGDRHHTELSSFVNAQGHEVYDLTVSPLTSGTGSDRDGEHNALRDEGTLVIAHNFGLLNFSGPKNGRQLKIQIMDVEGNEVWNRTIKAVVVDDEQH